MKVLNKCFSETEDIRNGKERNNERTKLFSLDGVHSTELFSGSIAPWLPPEVDCGRPLTPGTRLSGPPWFRVVGVYSLELTPRRVNSVFHSLTYGTKIGILSMTQSPESIRCSSKDCSSLPLYYLQTIKFDDLNPVKQCIVIYVCISTILRVVPWTVNDVIDIYYR